MADPKWRDETNPGTITGWIAIAVLIPFLFGIYSTTQKANNPGQPGMLEEPRKMIERTNKAAPHTQTRPPATQPATISTTGTSPQTH